MGQMTMSMGELPPPLKADIQEEVISYLGTRHDQEARSILIKHNLRLVVHIAEKFYNTRIDLDDLFSIGTIGLIKGVRTFNPEKGVKLGTYVTPCIRNEILMYLRKTQKQGLEVPLDEPLCTDADGNELTWLDVLEAEGAEASRDLELEGRREMLLEAIGRLNARDQTIIKLSFGIGIPDGRKWSQREIAESLDISQSYVSRLEKTILQELKKELLKAGF